MSGRQLIAFHDLALPMFERVMTRNVDREHFLQQPAGASPRNRRERLVEWACITDGWTEGDARPTARRPEAAG